MGSLHWINTFLQLSLLLGKLWMKISLHFLHFSSPQTLYVNSVEYFVDHLFNISDANN